MALVCFVVSFSTVRAQNSNPLDDVNAQLRTMFSAINPAPEPRNFLYERAAHRADSAFFAKICTVVTDVNNFMITYEEVRDMAEDQSVMPTSDSFYAGAIDNLPTQTVPIGLVDYDFYYLKDDALSSNMYFEFDSTTNILKSKGLNPYDTLRNIFAGSVLRFDAPNNVINFVISPQNILYDIYNEPYYTERQFRIDFGDGKGFIAFDPKAPHERVVTYATEGEKIITVAIVDIDNPKKVIKTSVSRILVAGVALGTQHDGALEGVEGFDVAIYYPCEQSKTPNDDFKKVAIYVEGIDIQENRNTVDIHTYMLKNSRLDELRNSGYTFLVLSYKNSRKSIIENGMHLVDLLHRLKLEAIAKQNHEQFVVIGESMGGLVSRYALCYMESEAYREGYRVQDNRMHNTRLLITIDSPHQGANVPLGLQALYRFATLEDVAGLGLSKIIHAPQRFLMAKMNQFLDCESAKQMLMLYYQHSTLNGQYIQHQARGIFLNNMASIGKYPKFCKKVALANGSLDGESQRRPYKPENIRIPGDVLMDLEGGLAIRILRFKPITVYGARITLRTNGCAYKLPAGVYMILFRTDAKTFIQRLILR